MPATEQAWIAWIRETTRRYPGDLPAFPAIAGRLVALVERADVEVDEIQQLISQDQAISAGVIRAANSVLYRGVAAVETVARAVMRLGFRETAQIALASAARTLYDPEDRVELEVFPDLWGAAWQDSLACAFGARLLARELKLGDPERAFLGAMFRHAGHLLILKMIARGLVRGRLVRPPEREELATVFDALHAGLGAEYLERAGMPDYVVEAAARHHEPDLSFVREHFELHLVRVADGLCGRLGISPLSHHALGPAAEQSIEALGIDAEQLEYFDLQLQQLAEQVSDLL